MLVVLGLSCSVVVIKSAHNELQDLQPFAQKHKQTHHKDGFHQFRENTIEKMLLIGVLAHDSEQDQINQQARSRKHSVKQVFLRLAYNEGIPVCASFTAPIVGENSGTPSSAAGATR